MVKQLINLFKLRIGIIMSITALVALIVTPGQPVQPWEALLLTMAVLLAASSAGAFNQYYERDLDATMPRTKNRPFVTGELPYHPLWLLLILLLLAVGVGMAGFVLNGMAALYIFLGAFFYAVVYTVWLKRRTWLNIVIGGASGSFAVLAGATVVDPSLGPVPIILAIVLFLWTPSHFGASPSPRNKPTPRPAYPCCRSSWAVKPRRKRCSPIPCCWCSSRSCLSSLGWASFTCSGRQRGRIFRLPEFPTSTGPIPQSGNGQLFRVPDPIDRIAAVCRGGLPASPMTWPFSSR